MLVSFLAYSSTLKMEAKYSCETSFEFQRSTRRYIAEDKMLCNHRCENLSSGTRIYDCAVGAEEAGEYPLIRVCLCLTVNANIVKKKNRPSIAVPVSLLAFRFQCLEDNSEQTPFILLHSSPLKYQKLF
jgi:hypothetical protein